jgi:hypothetical protein
MRRIRGVGVGLGMLCVVAGARGEGASVLVRPEFGVQAGVETYELNATIASSEPSFEVTASSKLSYPVATLLAGGSAIFAVGRFSLAATALTNLVDPWGTLLDRDFVSASSAGLRETIEFSHTDSRATLRALALEGALRFRIVELSKKPGKAPFYLVAGLRYEWSAYDAYGASGWQLDGMQNEAPFSIPDGVHALHYDVRYWLPFVGTGIDFAFGGPFGLRAEARLIASWSTHDDDHVLRHKLAHSLAHGAGAALTLEPALELTRGEGAAARVLIGLSGQFQFVGGLDGRLEQKYYADDPSLPGDQTGTVIPDADFSFTSLRVRLLAFVAIRF